MAFLTRAGSLDLAIPAGQSIALGSTGAGAAAIYYRTLVGNQPRSYYLQQYLAGTTVTLGPFPSGLDIRLVASVACDLEYVVGTSPVLSGTVAARQVTLSSDYTLVAGDDGTYFTVTTAVMVTVPAGLNPMPQCVFAPPATGSVTLHPTGGATLNGSASDIQISIITNPAPAGLTRTSVTDNYGVTTTSTVPWANLSGAPVDNAAWNTAMAAYGLLDAVPTKHTADYTLAASDHGNLHWFLAQAANMTLSIPGTLSVSTAPFRCRIAFLNNTGAVGRLKLHATATGTLNGAIAANGALVGDPIWMGIASTNCVAFADVESQGGNNNLFVRPVWGTFASA